MDGMGGMGMGGMGMGMGGMGMGMGGMGMDNSFRTSQGALGEDEMVTYDM